LESVISAETQASIGRQITRTVSYSVAASDIRRWVIAVYWPEPAPKRYLQPDGAELLAPEDFNPFAWAVAEQWPFAAAAIGLEDPDRTERLLGLDGPGLRFQLHGGLSIDYGSPIAVGDVITSVATLAGYTEREGSLGLMLMTAIDEVWTNQRGEFIKHARLNIIRY